MKQLPLRLRTQPSLPTQAIAGSGSKLGLVRTFTIFCCIKLRSATINDVVAGAGGPITDHGGVATAGLRYMLLHSGVSENGAATKKIVLFAAWPCSDWAVDFKLHAPGRTVVQGSYDGAGTLSNFTVTPPERKADVTFAACVKAVV